MLGIETIASSSFLQNPVDSKCGAALLFTEVMIESIGGGMVVTHGHNSILVSARDLAIAYWRQ